jgi:DNA-binding beta-propeller fold protein YncE
VNVTFTPTLAGTRYGAVELLDGSGNVLATAYLQGMGIGSMTNFLPGTESAIPSSSLANPFGVAIDGSGGVYIADTGNNRVLKETFSSGSYAESTVTTSALTDPSGIALDGAGNIYIADTGNNRILKETLTAGSYTESTVPTSALANPSGVAVDGSGNVYVADSGNNRVLMEALSAGNYIENPVPTSSLAGPTGVAVDGNGNVYVADTGNNRVLLETLTSGSYNESIVPSSSLTGPYGVAVDGSGNVSIADAGNNRILREILGSGSYAEIILQTSILASPSGVAVDNGGNVYIADSNNNRVLKEDFVDPPSSGFASTPLASTSSDSPQVVTVSNYGNSALSFSAISFPVDFPESTTSTTDCTGSSSLATTGTCTLTVDFAPTSSLSGNASALLHESIVITTNSLNASAGQQSINVAGTETLPVATMPIFSIPAGSYTSSQVVSIRDTTAGATIYYSTDGSIPTASSTVYSGPITVSTTEALNAIAIAPGYANSAIATSTYTMSGSGRVIPPRDGVSPAFRGEAVAHFKCKDDCRASPRIEDSTYIVSNSDGDVFATGLCTYLRRPQGDASV